MSKVEEVEVEVDTVLVDNRIRFTLIYELQ
jgi:hypothetical protein